MGSMYINTRTRYYAITCPSTSAIPSMCTGTVSPEVSGSSLLAMVGDPIPLN